MTRTRTKLAAPLLTFVLAAALLALVNRDGRVPGAAGPDLGAPAERFVALGETYLQRGRETGDPAWSARAARSFDAALRRDPRNLGAVVGAGSLALARHDFREGLRLARRARTLAPGSLRPYPVLIDSLVELGRYDEAGDSVQRFVDLKPTLASYARASYYLELTGDLDGAVDAMRRAVAAGAGASENLAYVQALLGDLELQRGSLGAARDAYRSALASVPGHGPASIGLARLDIARGRLGAAIARLRDASTRLPLPGTVALLAETELVAGREAAARTDLEVVRAQQRLLRASGTRLDVELVLFEAGHGDPARAVRLGRELYAAAPSVRSADALSWALTRAGRPAEGLEYADRALRTGARDPLFQLHAGLAAQAAGEPTRAERHLEAALGGRTVLSPLDAERARRALR